MDQPKPYIITIVGPESSGKTSLARKLSANFGGLFVPEYAREYLEGLEREFVIQDLELIARGQLESQKRAMAGNLIQSATDSHQVPGFSWQAVRSTLEIPSSNADGLSQDLRKSVLLFGRESFGDQDRPVVVIDSGMLSLRMWARLKYRFEIPVVEDSLAQDVTSMYVLCRPVYSWESDPLREAPALVDRVWIYNHYLSELRTILSK